MKARDFDKKFDADEDVSDQLDISKARRFAHQQKRVNVVLGDGDDKVHVQSGARLSAKRTCQRSTGQVTQPAALQGVRYRQSNKNGVYRQPPCPGNLEDSG